MMAADASALPDVADVLAPVLARVPRERQPLLIALAERMAAERYRGWADRPEAEAHRSRLLACARREEDIAERVEALYPQAGAAQSAIRADVPDLDEITRGLFADRPLRQQLTIQAQGERLGAATWRAFALAAGEPAAGVFEACALLEEESAAVLEQMLSGRDL